MRTLLGLDRAGLLALDPKDVKWLLSGAEVFHIAKMLEGYWTYDYSKLEQGKPGRHALLKSLAHSDAFFFSQAILEHSNLRMIMAQQIVRRLRDAGYRKIDCVIGVPKSASELGAAVAKVLDVSHVVMEKGADGRMYLKELLLASTNVLVVEDVCTVGTGFREAVAAILKDSPGVHIVRCDPVILNRGPLDEINIEDVGTFPVLSVTKRRIQSWSPGEACPLCQAGSEVIRPKADPGNWSLLTTSQD